MRLLDLFAETDTSEVTISLYNDRDGGCAYASQGSTLLGLILHLRVVILREFDRLLGHLVLR